MEAPTIRESLAEYGRGVVGGLLFAVPLLYTMEVWQTGIVASPTRLLVGIASTFALLLLFNRYSGLRRDASFREVVVDSVEEMALGLAVAVLVLLLTGRLHEGDGFASAVGKITVCGMMSAIGVSVGTAQLGTGNPQKDEKPRFGGQLAIALCGAVIVAGNAAPTEEIQRIAFEAAPPLLLGVLALSMALGAIVSGASDFRGARPFSEETVVPSLLFNSTVTVAIGLAASFALLAYFGALHGDAPSIAVAQTIVLGLPASLGAAVGRLLLQA